MDQEKVRRQGARPSGGQLERRVLRYVRRHRLFGRGDSVVAGVSGGPDSTALLVLLSRLAPLLGFSLSAAYFDHRLRGIRASKRERAFVERLTTRLGLPLSKGVGDVRAHAREHHLSIEESARELRYRFLADAAAEAGASVVAVGHTWDDQVETVLMHLLRGSGLSGLAGMTARSEWPVESGLAPPPRLVRPLLRATREETHEFCREAGLQPLEDISNRSLSRRRNQVRHEILPFLRHYNPRIDRALLRLSESAAAEREVLEYAAAAAFDQTVRVEEGAVRLSRSGLGGLPEGLRAQVFRLAARRLLGDVRDIGWEHWQAMAGSVDRPAGRRLDLPRGLRLEANYDEIVVSIGPKGPARAALPQGETPLSLPGVTEVGGWLFEAGVLEGAAMPPAEASPFEAHLDVDAVEGRIAIRRRHPGDRFEPLGLAGEKKLQDLFVDAKVPRQERDGVPVAVDGRGIIWVTGHAIADRAKVTPSTRRTLLLHARLREQATPAGR